MQVIPKFFPNSYTILCSVHILRNLLKNMKSKIDTDIFKNKILLKVWRTLSGALFLPLENSKILKTVKIFLKSQTKFLPRVLKERYKNFLSYLFKFYFSDSAVFAVGYYPYFDMITTNGNFSCSTYALESINRQLKIATGAGFLNLYKSCRVLRDFKSYYLLLHENRVRNDNLNRRRKEVLNREKQLEVILENFYDLPEESQIASSVEIAFSIGSIDKFVNLSQNLLSAHLSPVITSEEDLNETEFANMTGDSESDSDSEF